MAGQGIATAFAGRFLVDQVVEGIPTSLGNDTLRSTGTIRGPVLLGAGADGFLARTGRLNDLVDGGGEAEDWRAEPGWTPLSECRAMAPSTGN